MAAALAFLLSRFAKRQVTPKRVKIAGLIILSERKTSDMAKKKTKKKLQKKAVKKSVNAGRIECKYSKLEPLNKLNPNPQNPNIHTDDQIKKLADLIRLHGWRLPIIVSEQSGLIVAGHGRLLAAQRLGYEAAPVDFQTFKNEAEEYSVLISDNVVAELSSFDGLKMAELLNEIDVFNVNLEEFTALSEEQILDFIHGPEGPPSPEGEDDEDTVPEAPKKRAKLGDLYQLGEHRLFCGDSTKTEDVEFLMAGEKAHAVFTDPPYAIFGSSTGIAADITDDKMVRPFFRAVIDMCSAFSQAFAHSYICCDWRSWASWWEVSKGTPITPKNMIVWDKGGGLGGMYANCHELVFFASNRPMRNGMTQKISGERTVNGVNVWRANRAAGEETGGKRQHNAQKPIEIIEIALDKSTDDGSLVLDLFLGSGSTMIACEKLGRKCYGMEIDPHYCDVIISRWEDYTGKKAKKIKK